MLQARASVLEIHIFPNTGKGLVIADNNSVILTI